MPSHSAQSTTDAVVSPVQIPPRTNSNLLRCLHALLTQQLHGLAKFEENCSCPNTGTHICSTSLGPAYLWTAGADKVIAIVPLNTFYLNLFLRFCCSACRWDSLPCLVLKSRPVPLIMMRTGWHCVELQQQRGPLLADLRTAVTRLARYEHAVEP